MFSKVINPCFIHFRGCLSWNSSATILELTISWCSIPQTVQSNAIFDDGGFPLTALMNWSRSPLCTPALHYTASWPPFTTVWFFSHPIACCFLFLLLPVIWMIFKCASWVIFSVAGLAALRCTSRCLCCRCVPVSDALDTTPIDLLVLDLLSPGWGVRVAKICWC